MLAVKEKEKYEKIWAFEEYHTHSPGESIYPDAREYIEGGSVIDFGCGTGRATKKFIDDGLDATGVDFVKALEEDIPFVNVNLWEDLGDLLVADHGYCCDVMEHIPTEKVKAVLKNISDHVIDGCFFQIALFHDNMGNLIGERLHLTVKPSEWWIEVLSEFFTGAHEVIIDDHLYLAGYFKK